MNTFDSINDPFIFDLQRINVVLYTSLSLLDLTKSFKYFDCPDYLYPSNFKLWRKTHQHYTFFFAHYSNWSAYKLIIIVTFSRNKFNCTSLILFSFIFSSFSSFSMNVKNYRQKKWTNSLKIVKLLFMFSQY